MDYKLDYKFKPGDKVTVRKDLSHREGYKMLSGETPYDAIIAIPSMENLRGKQVTIESYDCCGSAMCYRVKENSRYWSDEMFEESKKPFTCKSLL